MRPFGVVPLNPVRNSYTSFSEVAEIVLPDTLLFEATKEPFDNAVLFRRVGSNKLLAQPVIATCSAKSPALENQSVVGTHHGGRAIRAQGTETSQAGFFQRPLSLLGPTAQGEFKTSDFAVVAINYRS